MTTQPSSRSIWSRFDDEVRGCLVECQAGEGGDDARLWARQLSEAYLAYCARNGLCPEIGEEGPSKWSFSVHDRRALDLFRDEVGGHCIQRVPTNQRNARRQTSMVAVMVTVLRTPKDTTMREVDLEESFQRGRLTAGGQHANKTSSAVRLRHRPTGVEVFINGRDQWTNRQIAREALAGKLVEHAKQMAESGRRRIQGRGAGLSVVLTT